MLARRGARLWHWSQRHAKDLSLVVLGVSLAFVVDSRLAARQDRVARDLANRAEVLENLRFVRSTLTAGLSLKPFAGLDLRGARWASAGLFTAQHCATLI